MDRRNFLGLTAATLASPLLLRASSGKPRTWKDGKKWVYSITYDEGPQDLLKYTAPLHRKYGIPGHVALVSSQIGVPRNVPGSSYHGMMILNKEEIHGLVKEGWGMSCHSLTHCGVTDENAQSEVVEARAVLENAIDQPITIFTVPGTNDGHPPALKVAAGAGYKAILTIYDRVNTPGGDMMSLGRVPLHTEYPGPFFSVFDPYKRIHQAMDMGGWIVDYCHCPMPDKPIHPAKDCTTQELEQRFDTVKRIGGDEVWLAEPNEVVEWLMAAG
ncbi:MAG: polysaccharide deacetylase family protein [Candidatus Hydrogenedentes bacterium]|nr:polysaccharide deacetylase family protein [Candidatus Hydrogenedentota bacterium]